MCRLSWHLGTSNYWNPLDLSRGCLTTCGSVSMSDHKYIVLCWLHSSRWVPLAEMFKHNDSTAPAKCLAQPAIFILSGQVLFSMELFAMTWTDLHISIGKVNQVHKRADTINTRVLVQCVGKMNMASDINQCFVFQTMWVRISHKLPRCSVSSFLLSLMCLWNAQTVQVAPSKSVLFRFTLRYECVFLLLNAPKIK
jgi:hypothetical protein